MKKVILLRPIIIGGEQKDINDTVKVSEETYQNYIQYGTAKPYKEKKKKDVKTRD